MCLPPIVSPLAVGADKMGVQCRLDRVQLLVEKARMKMSYASEARWTLEIENALRLSSSDVVLRKPLRERAMNEQL
jgi:hypothetical protein